MHASIRPDSCEIEVDCAVEALNAILNEEGDFDVAFVEEAVELLFDHAVVPGGELVRDLLELCCTNLHQLRCGRPLRHHLLHRLQMLQRHMHYLLRLTALQHLVLKSHQHQVE